MYLQCSVYIHWNIWLNELFYKINLHWGSLQPTQALNLLKVAKPPAKQCHSGEQRWEQMNRTQLWLLDNAPEICIKLVGSSSVWIHLGLECFIYVDFFANQWLQEYQVVFSRQTLVSRRIPICLHLAGLGAFWTSSSMLLALWPDYPQAVLMNKMRWFT